MVRPLMQAAYHHKKREAIRLRRQVAKATAAVVEAVCQFKATQNIGPSNLQFI